MRELLAKSGIVPENLPPEQDVKKLEREVKSDEKKMEAAAKKLPAKIHPNKQS